MGLVIEQMKKIRKIPIIEIQTSESFHKTVQNIIGEMRPAQRLIDGAKLTLGNKVYMII
jgi:hypothetical protein